MPSFSSQLASKTNKSLELKLKWFLRHVHGPQRLGVLGQLRRQAAAQSTGECHLTPSRKIKRWKWFEIINLGWFDFFCWSVTPKIGQNIHFRENILKEMGLIHPTSEASVYCGKWYIPFPCVWGSTSRDVCFCWFLSFPGIIELS